MKLIPFCILLCLFCCLLACEQEHAGSFSIEGYCYDTCGGTPLAHQRVQFNHYDRFFETYSDSNGYFELAGSFNYVHHISKEPDPGFIEFWDTTQSSTCCAFFSLPESANFSGDTIFGYHKIQTVLQVSIGENNGSNFDDTLFVSTNFRGYDGTALEWFRSDTETYSINYHFYFVGPFFNGQILDTLEVLVGPHVGHAVNASILSYDYRGPYLGSGGEVFFSPFERGQENIACDYLEVLQVDLSQ